MDSTGAEGVTVEGQSEHTGSDSVAIHSVWTDRDWPKFGPNTLNILCARALDIEGRSFLRGRAPPADPNSSGRTKLRRQVQPGAFGITPEFAISPPTASR